METTLTGDESGVTIGIDDAGFSASLSSSGILSLGIGVAGVDIDLSNPNNSSIDFGFGLFSIEGVQEGCQVVLTYRIAGEKAFTETRIVPDCDIDDPEPPPKPPPNNNDDTPSPTPLISNPYEQYRCVVYPATTYSFSEKTDSASFYQQYELNQRTEIRSGARIFYNPNVGWDFEVPCTGKKYNFGYQTINGERYILYGEDAEQQTGCTYGAMGYKYPNAFMVPSWYLPKEINGRPDAGMWGKGIDINAVIVRDLKSFKSERSSSGTNVFGGPITYKSVSSVTWGIFYEQISNEVPDITKIPPLFKEPKKMDCCEELKEKIDEIHRILGYHSFPFKLPESFISKDGNEPKNKDLPNYPEAFGYLLDRIDELIGQFNIDIEIEDTDPTTKGNQTAKISIGNISEGIAEIIGLIYGLGMSQKIGTEAAVKSLISLGMVQKVVTEIDAVTEEIFDHLEIPMKEVEREIDLEFSPGVKNFDAFFKPSKERVKVPERIQGKNAPTLQDQLDVLLQAATIIKSRGFRKVDPFADIGAQVVGNLASGLLDKYVLNNSEDPNNPPDPNKKSDFDEFIDDVQENFKKYEKPGEVDLEKSDNPKIIKLEKPTPTPKPTN